ncbi:hypothetical protein C8P68_104423 [Mucilaginibacter yixingensis]|uniref:Lipoprotein n=1 Tax=Mucilaginibacter yixingensis TaxID=1295612 RepID=A0A2T5JA92_9SPHI|nr:hypothetical protein [Mucilaginibacter yixingensis]PTQ96929.1 hypothetical protein C8P68_104423 [Mucilaginibacter yixingensis]
MKNAFKFGFVALALSMTIAACGGSGKGSAADTAAKAADSAAVKADTAAAKADTAAAKADTAAAKAAKADTAKKM